MRIEEKCSKFCWSRSMRVRLYSAIGYITPGEMNKNVWKGFRKLEIL